MSRARSAIVLAAANAAAIATAKAREEQGVLAEIKPKQKPQKGKAKPKQVLYQGNWTELQHLRKARARLGLPGEPIPAANVGRNHPLYGMTVQEVELVKRKQAERAQQLKQP